MHFPIVDKSNIISELQDYMFTSININRYTKHIINVDNLKPKQKLIAIKQDNNTNPKLASKITDVKIKPYIETIKHKPYIVTNKIKPATKPTMNKKDTMYRPKQKDSLFWCFYILKNGFFNYEMEINNQYFIVEKQEKFKYIEDIRKRKDILKLHKIKPLTELEDDLANKDKISVKTFFALCVLENINVLLVDKRKVYEILCVDIDDKHPINIIHRNSTSYEHSIELDPTDDIIKKYREIYYKMSTFDSKLKSISSYKLDELIDLCKKLDISIEQKNSGDTKTKISKKYIYELLVLNY